VQQVAHIFYAMAFLWLGSSGRQLNLDENTPGLSDFHRRVWAGEVDLADSQMKTAYGKYHWQLLSQNLREPRFNEAVRIVWDRSA
jgi:hypothetical protein